MDTKELVNELTDFVNTYDCDKDEFINQFCRQHRTLQQSTIRLLMSLIEHVGSDAYRFDARNEGAHDLCKKIVGLVPNPSQTLGFI